jgi:hypothetical protein
MAAWAAITKKHHPYGVKGKIPPDGQVVFFRWH